MNVRSPRAPSRYPSSSVSHRLTIQSPAFDGIDIAERAGVGKVKLDDLITVVQSLQWCVGMATGMNPHGRAGVHRMQERCQHGKQVQLGRNRNRFSRRYDWMCTDG
jgi:hypothetical protein